jgi:hypothetical protein
MLTKVNLMQALCRDYQIGSQIFNAEDPTISQKQCKAKLLGR